MRSQFIAPSSNSVVELKSAYDIVKHWDFLLSAMNALNDPRRARAGYTAEKLFNTLTRIADMDEGIVALLLSKSGKYLGFGCGFSAETFDFDKCFFVWQAYSNQKCHTALTELLNYCEVKARSFGHRCVKMSTPRMTKAADRLFEETLGFSREAFSYTKSIL